MFLFSELECDLCFLDDFFSESECLFLLLFLSESCACLSVALSSAEVFCFVAFWSFNSFVLLEHLAMLLTSTLAINC